MNKFTLLMAGLIVGIAAPVFAAGSVTARFNGRVADESGQPLAATSIAINRISGAPVEGDITALKTISGTDGTFDLPLRLRPTAATNVECELWFEQKGFVRAEETLEFPTNTNMTNTVNVVLRPGHILSGVVKPILSDKNGGPSGRRETPQIFAVASGEWHQVFLTGKDGAFEIYVPPGEYRFSVLSGRPFEIGGIKSGTTNLVIAPQPFVWSEQSVGKVFDDLWQAMDLQYSYFFLKTNVDWRAFRDEFRPQAIQTKNAGELATGL